jgi:putative FmdB family regulatory protein
MPIYDYACTVCGRVVEVVHGINGQGPTSCETCGGPMKKLMSSPAVHFKGSGWAKKDRRSNGSTTKAAAHAGQGGGGAESADAGDKGKRSELPAAARRTHRATFEEGGKGSSATGAPAPTPTGAGGRTDTDWA